AVGTVVLDGNEPVRMVGTCRDVSERVRLHRELRMRARQQEVLARLGERALTDGDLQKFLDDAVVTIGEILDVELVNILELVPGRDGRAYGVLGAHTTRQRRFNETEASFMLAVANVIAGAIHRLQVDQRQQLMIRELRHRSGNLFAQLLALFSQTAKNSKNLADLVTKYEARVLAMANAHRLITAGGRTATELAQIVSPPASSQPAR